MTQAQIKAERIKWFQAKYPNETEQQATARLIAEVQSSDSFVRTNAADEIMGFALNFTNKILYQELTGSQRIKIFGKLWGFFYDGDLDAGNGKEYSAQLETGSITYNVLERVPTGIQKSYNEADYIQFYEKDADGNDKISADAYQFLKHKTIMRQIFIPKFVSGKADEYIALIIGGIKTAFELFTYDRYAKLITAPATISKKITLGTAEGATDAFTTWNLIFNEINKMGLLNSDYTLNPDSQYLNQVDGSDLLVFYNSLTGQKKQSTIMTQLFNSGKFAPMNNIPQENFIDLGNQIDIKTDDQDAIIKIKQTSGKDAIPYLGTDEIIILEKSAIKHLITFDYNTTQDWAKNATTEVFYHNWGIMKAIGWKSGLRITAENINKDPSNA